MFFSLGFTSFRIVTKVDQPFKNQALQQFQDIGCHLTLLLLFLFTDFVTNPEAEDLNGKIYLGLFGVISGTSLIFITIQGVQAFIRKRKKDQYQRHLRFQQIALKQQKEFNKMQLSMASIQTNSAIQKSKKRSLRLNVDTVPIIAVSIVKKTKKKA